MLTMREFHGVRSFFGTPCAVFLLIMCCCGRRHIWITTVKEGHKGKDSWLAGERRESWGGERMLFYELWNKVNCVIKSVV